MKFQERTQEKGPKYSSDKMKEDRRCKRRPFPSTYNLFICTVSYFAAALSGALETVLLP